MKENCILFISILYSALFLSCKKTDNIQVRFSNQYYKKLVNVKVGPNSYNEVNTGETTGFSHVPEGSNLVTGVASDSSKTLHNFVNFSGSHYWTVTMTPDGSLRVKAE